MVELHVRLKPEHQAVIDRAITLGLGRNKTDITLAALINFADTHGIEVPQCTA